MDIMEKYRLDVMEENIRELNSFNEQVLKGQAIDYGVVMGLKTRIIKLEYKIEQMQEEINLLKTID